MSGRGRGRPKKSNDQSRIKNPGIATCSGGRADEDTTDSSSLSSEDSFENIHEDEVERMDVELEQGELLPEEAAVQEDNALRQMSELLVQIQRNQLETQNKVTELSGQMETAESTTHEFKKDGLKKQHDIAVSVLHKNKLAVKSLDNKRPETAKDYLKQGIDILCNRIKDLKIADSSDAGWETVNLYKSHPVAENAADARRIRRAEKLAKESMAAKSRRGRNQGRFGGRRNHNWQSRDDGYRNDRFDRSDRSQQSYRSVGSARSQYSGQRNSYTENRNDYRRRPSSNDLCFNCGQPGHWQDQCPNRPNRRD